MIDTTKPMKFVCENNVQVAKVVYELAKFGYYLGFDYGDGTTVYAYVNNDDEIVYDISYVDRWRTASDVEFVCVDAETFVAMHTKPVGREVSVEEAMEMMVAAGAVATEDGGVGFSVGKDVSPNGKVVSDGGSSDYYKITVNTKDGSFECETKDIIYALVGGDFDLGNALKALRRIYEASQGRGKDGITMEYDAKKIGFFVEDFLERFGEQA